MLPLMAYKLCSSCGKHIRDTEPRCWNCQSVEFQAVPTTTLPDTARATNRPQSAATTPKSLSRMMYCRECGNQLPNDAAVCMKCGVPTKVAVGPAIPTDMGQDAAMRMLLPVGRSGYAIAAGYLGLFSLLIVPAPLALLFGIIAVVHIKKNPSRHGMGRAIFGIVMGLLGTGVVVFIFLIQ